MDRTPEEFPNNIKNPYNQWETPLEFCFYNFIPRINSGVPTSRNVPYAQVTPL